MNATAAYIRKHAIPAALAMLPAALDTAAARAQMLAHALQESGFVHRRQMVGPAHGFWQFESGGGVHGVLTHRATKPLITPVIEALQYKPGDCYYAIVDNDILAAAFARLLIFSHPRPLPERGDRDGAWRYYIETWRPGKPHPETWAALYDQAWEIEDRIGGAQ